MLDLKIYQKKKIKNKKKNKLKKNIYFISQKYFNLIFFNSK
jgi:hypothetical protein